MPFGSGIVRLVHSTVIRFPSAVTFSFRFFRNRPGVERSCCIIWSRSRPELSLAGTMVPMTLSPRTSLRGNPRSARRNG